MFDKQAQAFFILILTKLTGNDVNCTTNSKLRTYKKYAMRKVQVFFQMPWLRKSQSVCQNK